MTTYTDLRAYLPHKYPQNPRADHWQAADDAQLIALLADGMSMKQCAAAMGRGYDSIRYRRYTLELPYVPSGCWNPAKSAHLTELIASGHSYQQAADILGVTRHAARNHAANTLGLTNRVRLWIDAEEQFLRENWGKMSLSKLERRLGKSRGAIRNKAARMGLA